MLSERPARTRKPPVRPDGVASITRALQLCVPLRSDGRHELLNCKRSTPDRDLKSVGLTLRACTSEALMLSVCHYMYIRLFV